MSIATHPFYTLRQAVLSARRQYRHNDDNSDSLFHPRKGFISGYDISEIDAALGAYEQTLGSEYQENCPKVTPEELVLQQAYVILDTHPSLDARNLAEGVINCFKEQQKTSATSLLESLKYVDDSSTNEVSSH